jgi:uncharacterized protein with HEPN domain
MRPETADAGYLWDMLNYCRAVAAAVQGRTFADYCANDDFRLAVERRVEIIGEAARRVSTVLREAHPEIPWRSVIGQRHALAHDYGEIDDQRIWRVATVHIPDLIPLLEPLVPPAVEPEPQT